MGRGIRRRGAWQRASLITRSAGRFLRVAKLDLRAGGPGRTKRQTAKLKLGRGLAGALFNQVEREGLRLFILILLHHL